MKVNGRGSAVEDPCYQFGDHERLVGYFEFADEADAGRRLEAETRVVRRVTDDKHCVDPQALAFLETGSYQR